jgi:hypothetical protein
MTARLHDCLLGAVRPEVEGQQQRRGARAGLLLGGGHRPDDELVSHS